MTLFPTRDTVKFPDSGCPLSEAHNPSIDSGFFRCWEPYHGLLPAYNEFSQYVIHSLNGVSF